MDVRAAPIVPKNSAALLSVEPLLEESIGHAELSKSNVCSDGQHFLDDLFQMIINKVLKQDLHNDTKVVEFMHPAALGKTFDFTITQESTSNDRLLEICEKVIKFSVKTGHLHFFNQLYGGLNPYALGGAWLTDALNTSQYTFEVAPVFTLMEKAVVDKMLSHIGFKNGDGLFSPGGSLSNMYAMNLARYRMFPNVKLTGVSGLPTLCVMTSERGHYSVKKGAAFLGVGMNNVIAVKTDAKGRMIPEELTRAIENVKSLGYVPFIVNATAGTTVFGAYDPLSDIADICETYGLWMHVDASWGGSVLLSDKLRHKVRGIGRADSVTWNPHKMMGVPFQAAGFFTRHKDILSECHSAKAKYLFQQDKFYDVSFDTGDKSIQCGRKVDALKLWLVWKAKGSRQFAADMENIFNCANYLAQKLDKTEGFRLVVKEPECTNVCFWYIPPSLRTLDETAEWWDNLSKVAPIIKQRMTEQGTLLIGYQPDGDLVNFFRMVVVNHKVTEQEMDFVIGEIERLGKDI